MMTLLRLQACALALCFICTAAHAAPLIVIDARGTTLKAGQKIDSGARLVLKEGERITLIAPDGKTITLRGKFDGPPLRKEPEASNPRRALAALINTRNARTSSVGVVRGASDAAPLPEPWLLDMSRAGERCVKIGERPTWWRPDDKAAQQFTVLPVDRSWRADFDWKPGQATMGVPSLAKFDAQTIFVIRSSDREYSINLNLIPADLGDDLILASWMLEKGCIQQADALLKSLSLSQGGSESPAAALQALDQRGEQPAGPTDPK